VRGATKLGLGTVQFGLDYGVSNAGGRTPPAEVRNILAVAAAEGLRVLDTARLYGESELALGDALSPGDAFRIVTKTPKFPQGFGDSEAAALETALAESLRKLRRPSVYGLLAHQASDLLGPGGDRMMDTLYALKAKGLVEKVGASIYSGDEIESLLSLYRFDLIQVPINALDQRLLRGGHLRALRAAGVEVHARSIFLQGLLLMDRGKIPGYFGPILPLLDRFAAMAAGTGNTPLQAALDFACGRPEIDVALVGVNDAGQLRQILSAEAGLRPGGDYADCHCDDERYVNPSRWKLA
jgi:aryl-alcohol dehydrogenase-like predicted oxidoreductase